jgi:hypothetical protein
MNDVQSVNFQFLLIARDLTQSNRAGIVTGLPQGVVDRIANLTIQQLEQLAESQVCLFTFRFTESELDIALKQIKPIRNAYLLSRASTL